MKDVPILWTDTIYIHDQPDIDQIWFEVIQVLKDDRGKTTEVPVAKFGMTRDYARKIAEIMMGTTGGRRGKPSSKRT
jgi:hypothetical protein